MTRLQLLEDEIGRKLAQAQVSGELRAAKRFGKPLEAETGWDEAPQELRMGFKILKDAGFAPPEVALFHERARLKEELFAATGNAERCEISKRLALAEQLLALRLEAKRA